MTCAQRCGCERVFGAPTARRELRRYRRVGPRKSTRRLLAEVARGGVAGATFLDVGGGIGAIQHELMARGAARGTSVDASPAYVAAARREARARGYEERMRYFGGDLVERAAELEPADVVTLDRVVCCYPDMPRLLETAAALTGRALGLAYPRRTRLVRLVAGVVNLLQRARRHPFRVFVHDPAAMEAVIRARGLTPKVRREGPIWAMTVCVRDPDARQATLIESGLPTTAVAGPEREPPISGVDWPPVDAEHVEGPKRETATNGFARRRSGRSRLAQGRSGAPSRAVDFTLGPSKIGSLADDAAATAARAAAHNSLRRPVRPPTR